MSINRVNLKNKYQDLLGSANALPFDLATGETVKFFSRTDRQNLGIKLTKQSSRDISITASDGYIYLTNLRLIYITRSKGDIDTFLMDLAVASQLQFSHELVSPWFGANYWKFLFYSAQGISGGFLPNSWYEGNIKFNDGGVFDFVLIFNTVINDAINNQHVDEELPQYVP
ncbi:uncharacterized protein KQ657_003215 [Scheffersomyces spartinae]|uniref:Uncharacterized protein n=1 Tax=Scheffersomyces spartinae TaxID=45513 RepID=A0A9P8AK40_9ASCO|nr:uncharacterized protein KQ657_003215 [Scheffersomyces spartinae]KAG7195453.1 hypothetical protein KQ657_003215 [Scheffersomyces spartinae]